MGSSQSTPAAATQSSPPPSVDLRTISTDVAADVVADQGKPKSKRKQNLSGFALVQHKCRRKKRSYDVCYAELYGGFMMAKETDSTACDEVFEDWRLCMLKGMKKDREKRGLPPPNKESILSELEEEDN